MSLWMNRASRSSRSARRDSFLEGTPEGGDSALEGYRRSDGDASSGSWSAERQLRGAQ